MTQAINRRILRTTALLLMASLWLLMAQPACAQNTFNVMQQTTVFSPSTTSCVGCNVIGITESDIDSDSTMEWSPKYTYAAFQAYGNYGECGSVTFFDGNNNNLGSVPVCVGAAVNIPNNSRSLGTAKLHIGQLNDFLVITSAGDSVNYSPSIIATLVR